MAFWDRWLAGFGRKAQITSSLDLFKEIYGSRLSAAGVTVNWQTALQVTTVLACCRVRAEGLSVPFRLYQETEGGRKIAADHPLHLLISRRPNKWQTSLEFLETISFHLDLTFNAYVFVNRVGRAREIRELIPLEPNIVRVERLDNLSLRYFVRGKSGVEQEFAQETIWHLRGPSWNSWLGMDPILLARNAIGLSIAAEQSQASLHKQGGRIGGLLSVEGTLNEQGYSQLRAWIEKNYGGPEHDGKWLLLDRKTQFTPMTMKGVDSQHLETRKHQIEEICRAMRVWPIMVGHSGDQTPTFASASEFFQAHKTYTLDPLYRRISQSANVNLLSEDELRGGYYTKFVVNALMNANLEEKAAYYGSALGSGGSKGWLTQNEIRDFEDMDRSDDPKADDLPQQAAEVAAAEVPGDE